MHHRTQERELLKRKLEHGISLHMPAPRRIGKTWTLNRLAEDLRQDGWIAVEVDVEGLRTTEAFARDLCKCIEKQQPIKDRFKAHLSQRVSNVMSGKWGVNPLDALKHVEPTEFVETLIASLHDTGKPAAILIDEVAYFFLALAETNADAARDFAYRLRALQQRYNNVRWLLTGSIGLATIARRYGLEGAFVNFEHFTLEPFTPAQARSYLRDPTIQGKLHQPFNASDADFDHLFTQLGWLTPYYLLMIANEVRPSLQAQGQTLATAADFDAAVETLLRPNRQSEFAIWREHINKNLPAADRAIATSLLNALSAHPDGESQDTLLAAAQRQDGAVRMRQVRDILTMLFTDGLITRADERYSFRSGLVRRYWREYEAE